MLRGIGRRTGEFVGTTAQLAVRAVEELLPGVHPPRRHRRMGRLSAVAGAALALAAGAAGAASQGRRKVIDLTDKSHKELYELARRAGIPGRSGMSKEQLTRALSR